MHNNLARYLIFFQYTGTKYSGVVKVPPHQLKKKGVQDHLEEAILRLRPVNPVSILVSSRTDAGVHALMNSAHFDLQRKHDKPPFTEDILTEALNYHLRQEQIRKNGSEEQSIIECTVSQFNNLPRVTDARRVWEGFHARFDARSRTYVYRLGLGPSKFQFPLTESELCWNLCNTELDVDSMRAAASLLEGTHDFSSFRSINSDLPFKNPVKTLDLVRIQHGISFTQDHFHRKIPYWELTFRSRSFLYKQVRRMTGALVAVGQGRLSVAQLKKVLEERDSRAYPQGMSAPAHGLFLTNVEYRETDLQPPTKTSEEQHE